MTTRLLPLAALAAFAAAGCASPSDQMSKEDEGKMKNWLEKGIPAGKGGPAPAPSVPLQKNDAKTGTPTD